ncbi:MAG TPA: hypothetical protein VIG76_12090 [Amnibacterium sp.]|jgi:heme/copper-type cytochrome/quinol oxidase subunit 1|uniref:hypothetical protein n=1 Tax=Amnibacterium sp. TaxID=1872496 RepID=UPI002F92668F
MARLWFAIAAGVGVLAAVAGLAMILVAPAPASFGWTAYAPLPKTVYAPPSSHQPLGLLLVVAGSAMAGSGLTGVVLARRGRP